MENSWGLPCLLKFGQLARMVVWVTSIHFRREAKLAEPFSRRECLYVKNSWELPSLLKFGQLAMQDGCLGH